ncbi:hypothetical protein [Streptomyces sp. CC228A]|uniref:hypothetical protein n=1 Tax=Streptomyces sp. CC228A TaxID=2898186 RepID=UPI001F3896BC|nr:hypothetical protein [Streptomyces sp. CC228A]
MRRTLIPLALAALALAGCTAEEDKAARYWDGYRFGEQTASDYAKRVLVAVVVPNLRAVFSLVRHRFGAPVGGVACRVIVPGEAVDAVGRGVARTA